MKPTLRCSIAAALALLLASTGVLRAQTTATWTGATDSNWDLGTNWTPMNIPNGPSDAALFNASSGSNNITSSGFSLGSLNFASDALANTITTSGTVYFYGAGIHNFSSTPQTLVVNPNSILGFYFLSSAGSVIITNNGSLTFGTNSTAGSATITNNDTIYFINSATSNSAAITNGSSGTIDFTPGISNQNLGSLAGGGTVLMNHGTLSVGSLNTSTTFSGVLNDGFYGSNLTKVGTGTLTLTGDNIYSGTTTISAGTLALAATGSLANTPAIIVGGGAIFDVSAVTNFTLGAGQTLGGTGSIAGPLTLGTGAHLAPGNSPGTITFTDGLTLNDGSVLDFQLGTASDLIAVTGGPLTGAASPGGITLNLTDSGGFAANTYVLFDFTGASLSGFDVSDFTLGTTISGYDYAFNLTGTSLELIATAAAIPEPSTYAAILGFGALGFVVVRRRLAAAKQ